MNENTNCYLCGNSEIIQRQGCVRDAKDIKIYQCKTCELVFLSSFDHIREDFYEKSGMHEEALDVKAWLLNSARDDARRFEYLKELLPSCSLLDFGCGAGGFLIQAQKLADPAHGIEPESRLFDHFQSQNLTVYPGLPSPSQDNTGRYDIITMFHVMEHLSDPKTVLEGLAHLLSDRGQIIIEVPSADDALLTLYDSKPFSEFTYWSCHLFLFTMKNLEMLFSQAGFIVNYIKQVQRYPLSNHLYWLAKEKPGGHQQWHFLDSSELHTAYEKHLAAIGKCDTIIASISNP